MNNFNEKNPESVVRFALEQLRRHELFTLATVDKSGMPWVVCLNLCIDDKGNIIWKSASATNHSKNITDNPNVAICIFSKTKDQGEFGFYASSVAHEVVDESELLHCVKTRWEAKGEKVPPIQNFQGEAALRIYYAQIIEAWVNDDRHLKTKVDLEILRKLAKS